MQIVENSLTFDAKAGTIGGKLIAVNNSSDDGLLAADLALPGLTFAILTGTVVLSIQRIGEAIWLKPDGLWSYAIVLPLGSDLNGDGVVDSADIGRALAQWQSCQSAELLGQVLADQGSEEQVVGYASVSIAGASTASLKVEPAMLATPLPSASDAVLRVRLWISPGAKAEFAPAIAFGR